jgi:acyl-CoA thioesterase-1
MSHWQRFLTASIAAAAIVVQTPCFAQDQPEKAARKARKAAPNPAMQPVEDVPGLPRVLLIGDSISIGYTVPVRKLLEVKANVHRPLTNCGPTKTGLAELDRWLGDKPWDVIHFNWGLHDLKYVVGDSSNIVDRNTPNAHQQVPPAQYEQNLRELVQRLKKTGATLIWCSTTPVPEGAQGRVADDSVQYNEIAERIMREHNIAIDDLHAFAKPKLTDIQLPKNVHFTGPGSEQLAEEVPKSITKALESRTARPK